MRHICSHRLREPGCCDADSEWLEHDHVQLRQQGNLAQKITDGVTTTYLYDYANRLIALGSQGATNTYGDDAFGSVRSGSGNHCA